jgi:hypothetical protein
MCANEIDELWDEHMDQMEKIRARRDRWRERYEQAKDSEANKRADKAEANAKAAWSAYREAKKEAKQWESMHSEKNRILRLAKCEFELFLSNKTRDKFDDFKLCTILTHYIYLKAKKEAEIEALREELEKYAKGQPQEAQDPTR